MWVAALRERPFNAQQDPIQVFGYLVIPESQHPETQGFKLAGAIGVELRIPIVLTTIDIHHQSLGPAAEIDNVRPNYVLSSELVAVELAHPQTLP